MTDPVTWPRRLRPAGVFINPVYFSRSGGPSLGGIEQVTRTDLGHWEIDYKSVGLYRVAHRRLWNGTRTSVGGAAGSLIVPAWSLDSAPWAAGTVLGKTRTPHSDDTPHSDGALYSQPTIYVEMAVAAAISDTSVVLRLVAGIDELAGVRFSYEHALYETGFPTALEDDLWTVPIFPAIRAPIPADTLLEMDAPTCRVRLADDRQMDVPLSSGMADRADVSFKEDVAYWNELAEQLAEE
jgi:hypothetical protein